MINRLLLTMLLVCCLSPNSTVAGEISYPRAPKPDPDRLIVPPRENPFFFTRTDGQAFTIQSDSTCNLSDYVNRHYYDYNWRGETWAPFDQAAQPEKGSRLMHGWAQYDAATQGRICTGWHKFWEKWSGFGPQ